MPFERFRHFEYTITGDERDIDERDNISEEIRTSLQNTFEKVQRKKKNVIKELTELVEKYPDIAQFKNHLLIAYAQQGNMAMANQINELTLKQHPDYLFAKLNLASDYLAKKEYEKIPEVLGPLIEIKALYPHRDVFHINEVASFYKVVIHYFLAIGNFEAAESRLKMLEGLPRDLATNVEDLTLHVLKAKAQRDFNIIRKQENARPKRTITKVVIPPTTEFPLFHHPEVAQLYHHNLQINHGILQEILALPKETLLQDLHKIVYDSIARFDYFADGLVSGEELDFLLHALLLIGEIGDESSLPVVLDMLRQDEEYLEFYFGDHIPETVWEVILKVGMNQTDLLKQFILEGNYYEFARSAVSTAMEQLAFHFPERKEEVIQWYNDILLFFLANKDNESLIDTGFISFMISDLTALRALSLEPLIEELYHQELIQEFYVGSLEEVKRDLHFGSDIPFDQKRELLPVLARYDYILNNWEDYKEEDEFEDAEILDDDYFDDEGGEELLEVTQPIVRSAPKVGRNDPCPCGSGKKYKKCHG
jgi:hypothetical protein